VLPLLKDKTLYLTLNNENFFWLKHIKREDYQSGEFLIKDLMAQVSNLCQQKQVCNNIDITIESSMCRFIVLPALKRWPEDEVFNFLVQQKFQQKYLDYNPNDFVILHDQIQFNQPCVVVALSKINYEKILKLQAIVKIRSLIPSILAIWNYYEKNLSQSTLLIVEHDLIYLIQYTNGLIQDIDVFPIHLKLTLSADDTFIISNKTMLKSKDLSFRLPHLWKSKKDQTYGQILNFMRLTTHG
jgi:hypothetical protein